MIMKIQPHTENIYNALDYNLRKATGPDGIHDAQTLREDEKNAEKGHILAVLNVPEGKDIRDEFMRLQNKNLKVKGKQLKETCFHMSINPGEGDKPLSERDIIKLTGELMKELGYGDVPYCIFKHTDTGRTHYHVVATRIGQDGKKINDSFENRRINKISERLGQKYGFVMGNPEDIQEEDINEKEETTENKPVTPINIQDEKINEKKKKAQQSEKEVAKKEDGKPAVNFYSPENGIGVGTQFKLLHEEAMKWHFSTPEQYHSIMQHRFCVLVEEFDNGLHMYGLVKGQKSTLPLTEKEIGINAIHDVLMKCDQENMSSRLSQKKRINELTEWAKEQDSASNWAGFKKLMAQKGVIIVLHHTDEGKLFGVTYLDRATRCAWKGSELAVGLGWLTKTAKDKGWTIPAPKKKKEKRKKNTIATERKTTVLMPRTKQEEKTKPASTGVMQRTTQVLEALKHTGKRSNAENRSRTGDIYEDEAEKIMNWKAM